MVHGDVTRDDASDQEVGRGGFGRWDSRMAIASVARL
jgi:hypothetical protein